MPIYSTYQHQSESFKPEQLGNYRLRLFIREQAIVYVVISPQNQILAVKEYGCKSPIDFPEFFDKVYEKDYFLKEDYQSVQVINATMAFSLIPNEFFAPKKVEELAGVLIGETKENDQLSYCEMEQAQATAVYAIPFSIKQKCDHYFAKPQYLPSCGPLIAMGEALLQEGQNLMLLTLIGKQFVVIVWKKGKMHLCNSYNYQTATDLVYFVELVADILDLKSSDCEILINGNIEPEDDLYAEVRSLLPHVKVPVAALKLRFATHSDKLPHSKYAFLSY